MSTSFRGNIDANISGGSVGISGGSVGILAPLPQQIGLGYTNHSIASLAGTSEQLMAANASRHLLVVENAGANPVAINLTGGAAALNSAGSLTLAAGERIVIEGTPPTSAITVIGTAAQPVTAYEA